MLPQPDELGLEIPLEEPFHIFPLELADKELRVAVVEELNTHVLKLVYRRGLALVFADAVPELEVDLPHHYRPRRSAL